MLRFLTAAIFSGFLLIVGCEDDTRVGETAGTVAGLVTDSATGDMIDSAWVSWGDHLPPHGAYTDTTGHYSFQHPSNGGPLTAEKEGYRTVQKWPNGSYPIKLDFVLPRQ